MHDVPLLSRDADIAANAQAWADVVPPTAGHSPSPRIVNGESVGENAGSCSSCAGIDRVIKWYSEIEYTSPYGRAQSSSDSTVEGESVGHYTAVVWKSTSKLGCGTAKFTHHSGTERDFWVCQYGSTRGNTNGLFGDNVLAPTKSEAECIAEVSGTWTTAAATTTEVTTPTEVTTQSTTTMQPQCQYVQNLNTAVKYQGTGGSKLKRADYESVADYLKACEGICNADATCGGFVDDPTDIRGRMCKPKTASEGYPKNLKIFYKKGSGC